MLLPGEPHFLLLLMTSFVAVLHTGSPEQSISAAQLPAALQHALFLSQRAEVTSGRKDQWPDGTDQDERKLRQDDEDRLKNKYCNHERQEGQGSGHSTHHTSHKEGYRNDAGRKDQWADGTVSGSDRTANQEQRNVRRGHDSRLRKEEWTEGTRQQDMGSDHSTDDAAHKESHRQSAEEVGVQRKAQLSHKTSSFKKKANHKRGHRNKGYHNKFHRDEYQKEHRIYDDNQKGGDHRKGGRSRDSEGMRETPSRRWRERKEGTAAGAGWSSVGSLGHSAANLHRHSLTEDTK